MFNANTERLLDYWRARRGDRPAPRRVDIDVADFPTLAPNVFIAELQAGGDVRFRLAGEAIGALCGRPLRGESLLALWAFEHRGRLSRLLTTSLGEAEPLVVLAVGDSTDRGAVSLELLFAPLTGPFGALDRFLGFCQTDARRAATAPLGPLSIVAVNGVADAARRARLRLAALDGRQIA